jgi:hypothetical protein
LVNLLKIQPAFWLIFHTFRHFLTYALNTIRDSPMVNKKQNIYYISRLWHF